MGLAVPGAVRSDGRDPAARPRHRRARARGDHAAADRAGQGRRLPRRAQPRHRRLRPGGLRPAVRRDERVLESVLRLHAGRPAQAGPPDGLVPEGVRPSLPDRPRRSERRRTAARARAAAGRRRRAARGEPCRHHPRRLEPAGLRRTEPAGKQRAGVLPGQPVRRRRRRRPLRHPRQGGVGGRGRALPGSPVEAVLLPGVGPLGHRRPRVRAADGRLRRDRTAGRA